MPEGRYFSLCIPIFNWLQYFEQVLPLNIAQFKDNPHVELCIVDGGSTDGTPEFMQQFQEHMDSGLISYYQVVPGMEHCHLSRMRNLTHKLASGFIQCPCEGDGAYQEPFFRRIDRAFADNDYQRGIWISYMKMIGKCKLAFHRDDILMVLGGFDERFMCYGKDDRDVRERLRMTFRKVDVKNSNMVRRISNNKPGKRSAYKESGSDIPWDESIKKCIVNPNSIHTPDWGSATVLKNFNEEVVVSPGARGLKSPEK